MQRVATRLMVAVCALGLVSGAGLGAGGWYYSDQVLATPATEPVRHDVRIAEVIREEPPAEVSEAAPATEVGTTARVVLEVTEGDLVDLATVGLRSSAGLVLLDGAAEVAAGTTTRTGTLIEGEWPQAGDLASASVDTYAGDPAVTLGVLCDEVQIVGDLGPLPAWRSVPPGSSDEVWAVVVHGRGADKAQGNRVLATTYELGLPTLLVSVRNDPDAPAAPDGYGRYGATEWEDLQAAIDHLQEVESAERFVLVGYSQGASLVLSFLRHSSDAVSTDRAVLVSPLVSLHETLALHARQRDIPGPLIPPLLTVTRWVAAGRSGLDFSDVEHLRAAHEIPAGVELLVTHGDEDAIVPVGPSRELATALPGQVVYEEYRGVGHVREWNADRERFEADLRTFLREPRDTPVDAATPRPTSGRG